MARIPRRLSLSCGGRHRQAADLTGSLHDIARIVAESDFKPPAVAILGDVVNVQEEIELVRKSPAFRQAHCGDADAKGPAL